MSFYFIFGLLFSSWEFHFMSHVNVFGCECVFGFGFVSVQWISFPVTSLCDRRSALIALCCLTALLSLAVAACLLLLL